MSIVKPNIKASKNDILKDWVLLFADDLFKWAMYKTSNKQTAEDLVQETFLAAFNGYEKFQGKSKPKTWLFSIINHKIADFHRRQFRCPVINQSKLNNSSAQHDVLENYFDGKGTWKEELRPSEWEEIEVHLLDNTKFTKVLDGCMDELPETWYSAMHLKYLKEKKGVEICQVLGITATNFWQILHRAKIQLRNCLEENWYKSQQLFQKQ